MASVGGHCIAPVHQAVLGAIYCRISPTSLSLILNCERGLAQQVKQLKIVKKNRFLGKISHILKRGDILGHITPPTEADT